MLKVSLCVSCFVLLMSVLMSEPSLTSPKSDGSESFSPSGGGSLSPGSCLLSGEGGCPEAVARLQAIVLNKVSGYADCFDNFERTKNGVCIYMGSGKFWVLDMRVVDARPPDV